MKPGYQLHVTSWENDGDHYNTTITSGLSETDARFLIYIANQFGGTHSRKKSPFNLSGNAGNKFADFRNMYWDALASFPNVSAEYVNAFPDAETAALYDEYIALPWNSAEESDPKYDRVRGLDCLSAHFDAFINDLIISLLGVSSEYYEEYGFVRVCESIKVFYIPGEIEDVTNRFIN